MKEHCDKMLSIKVKKKNIQLNSTKVSFTVLSTKRVLQHSASNFVNIDNFRGRLKIDLKSNWRMIYDKIGRQYQSKIVRFNYLSLSMKKL